MRPGRSWIILPVSYGLRGKITRRERPVCYCDSGGRRTTSPRGAGTWPSPAGMDWEDPCDPRRCHTRCMSMATSMRISRSCPRIYSSPRHITSHCCPSTGSRGSPSPSPDSRSVSTERKRTSVPRLSRPSATDRGSFCQMSKMSGRHSTTRSWQQDSGVTGGTSCNDERREASIERSVHRWKEAVLHADIERRVRRGNRICQFCKAQPFSSIITFLSIQVLARGIDRDASSVRFPLGICPLRYALDRPLAFLDAPFLTCKRHTSAYEQRKPPRRSPRLSCLILPLAFEEQWVPSGKVRQ